jgi:hypothetical protein
MNPMAEKYKFVFLSRSTILVLMIPSGSGASGKEPSSGVESDSLIAGEY